MEEDNVKRLTTENKVHLEKRLVMENMTDERIRSVESELDAFAEQGYDPKDLRPFYERCKQYHLINNLGYFKV